MSDFLAGPGPHEQSVEAVLFDCLNESPTIANMAVKQFVELTEIGCKPDEAIELIGNYYFVHRHKLGELVGLRIRLSDKEDAA